MTGPEVMVAALREVGYDAFASDDGLVYPPASTPPDVILRAHNLRRASQGKPPQTWAEYGPVCRRRGNGATIRYLDRHGL